MNSHKIVFVRMVFILLSVLFLSGYFVACISRPTLTPTPTPTANIDREKAIELAIRACKRPHLVLVGEPSNIRAELLSLSDADRMTKTEEETTNFDISKETGVWLVQMDGLLQLVGGPAPEISADDQTAAEATLQPFQGTCSAALDASSGDLIFVRDQR
jgi:hypothetical protein